jgi:hypothetical protein
MSKLIMQKNVLFLFVTFILLSSALILSGCVQADISSNVTSTGSGTADIVVSSYQEIDSQVNEYFAGKKDLSITKQYYPKKSYSYVYTINFSFDKLTELSKSATFKSTDTGVGTEFVYSDVVDGAMLSPDSQYIPDITYCASLPGIVTKFIANSINDTTYNGQSKACVTYDSADKTPVNFTLTTYDAKKGCAYNNPACSVNNDCIDNICVLKKGCAYNNPACSVNNDCIDNICVLKKGCNYNNPSCGAEYDCLSNTCVKIGCDENHPACGENYNCVENKCVEKPPYLLMGLIIIAILFGGVIFVYSKMKKEGKFEKEKHVVHKHSKFKK